MTTQERLNQANEQSVSLYLQRQQLESKLQEFQLRASQVDQKLIRLDGIIEILQSIIEQENQNG